MRLKESIDEILAQNDSQLADSFYQRLFKAHPELSEFFVDTSMPRQKLMLTLALQTIAYNYRRPNVAMSAFLKQLGVSHRKRRIARQDLSKFRDVLLVAIEEFHGSDWSEALAAEWTAALDGAIELMNAGADA